MANPSTVSTPRRFSWATVVRRPLSELQLASRRVLHALEHPEYNDLLPSRIPAEAGAERRAAARRQIDEEPKHFGFTHSAEIVLTDGEPSAAILEYIQSHAIDLVVMGTIARSGLRGVFRRVTCMEEQH